MAKYKRYDYSQKVFIPVSLEDQLMPGTLEFAIHTLIETRMDMSVFDGNFKNDETGRSAYDPKVLLKIVLLGYSRGLISSRKIERACCENVTFMAMSCNQRPDHSTIAAFVSSMKGEILPLFRDILLVCEEENLLGGTFFALDGCKLSSNASKQWSGKFADIKKKKDKIEKKVKRLLAEQIEADKNDSDDLTELSNREKQVKKLQKQANRIEKWLKEASPKIGKKGREINSNATDNDSATLTSIHGTIQGYNAQALVDSKNQVIVHGEAFGRDDSGLLAPMVKSAKSNMEAAGYGKDYFEGKTFTTDSNYHNKETLKTCDQEKLDAYIPDKRFRSRDPNFKDNRKRRAGLVDRFRLEHFHCNEDNDEYRCPNGKVLTLHVKKTVYDGIVYRGYAANKADCKGCELKVKCLRRKNAKRKTIFIPIGHVPGNLFKAMQDKIDSDQGRRIYSRRIAIVEPVFANIRTHKEMNRLTLRGKIKVNIQWMLYCMVHNIGKIVRCGLNYGFT